MRNAERQSMSLSVGAVAVIAAVVLSAVPVLAQDTYEQRVADLREAGELQDAAALACEWATRQPGNTVALRQCAELAAAVGRYARAEEALRSLSFYAPADPDVMLKLGDVLLQRGYFAEAREQFEAAIQAGGDPGASYAGLARVTIYDAEDPGDMLSAAEVAMAVAPDDPRAHVVMGAVLREVGRPEEALETLRRAAEMVPATPAASFELGRTWAQMGEAERAREAWARFVEMSPHSSESWLLRHGLLITGVETITDRAFDAVYSADGSRIAYRAQGDGGWGVYTIPAEGPPVEERLWASEANIQMLAWSPDGALIAVAVLDRQQAEGGQQWTRRLFVVPTGGGEAEMLLEARNMGEIAWNPADGRLGVRTHVPRQGHVILQIDPATGESERVEGLARGAIHLAPAWSPDGSTLLLARRGAQLPDGSFAHELMIGPADDFSSARVIHALDEVPRGPTFTPDGSAILFTRAAAPAGVSTWAIPIDGSRDPVLVDHLVGRLGAPSLSPCGRFMLTTRETTLVRATLAGLTED